MVCPLSVRLVSRAAVSTPVSTSTRVARPLATAYLFIGTLYPPRYIVDCRPLFRPVRERLLILDTVAFVASFTYKTKQLEPARSSWKRRTSYIGNLPYSYNKSTESFHGAWAMIIN
jgi:hypothetical protein